MTDHNIAIRADSSHLIGTGHVMRCLALAGELRKRGARTLFISRDMPESLKQAVTRDGHSLTPIASDSGNKPVDWRVDADASTSALRGEASLDWLVVDHYSLDAAWEAEVGQIAKRTMAIDDLANRPHVCNILLDQNHHRDAGTRYDGLVPDGCIKLLGPSYALLRSEFSAVRSNGRICNGTVDRILISFGGADPTNETVKAIAAVRLLQNPRISVDIVIGEANPHREEIIAAASGLPNATCHIQPVNFAELMMRADLAIGGGGTSSWERCCLGVPGVVISVADNQDRIAESLHKAGVIFHVGRSSAVSVETIVLQLQELLADPQKLARAASKGMKLVDGSGAVKVANAMWDLQ